MDCAFFATRPTHERTVNIAGAWLCRKDETGLARFLDLNGGTTFHQPPSLLTLGFRKNPGFGSKKEGVRGKRSFPHLNQRNGSNATVSSFSFAWVAEGGFFFFLLRGYFSIPRWAGRPFFFWRAGGGVEGRAPRVRRIKQPKTASVP